MNLTKLTFQPTLAGTVLRMHRQTIKKQVNNAITKMSWEERDELKSQLGKMTQMGEDEHHFFSATPSLEGEKSLFKSKPDDQPTQEDPEAERNNNEHIYQANMWMDGQGMNKDKN